MFNLNLDLLQTNIPAYLVPIVGLLMLGMGVVAMFGYKSAKKSLAFLASCFGKMSFGLVASGFMLAGGVTVGGFSIGDLAQQPSSPEVPTQERAYFTNEELINLAKDDDIDQAKLESILEYSDLRAADKEGVYVASIRDTNVEVTNIKEASEFADVEQVNADIPAPVDQIQVGNNILPIQADIAMLGLGIALIISSIVTFIREVN